VGTAKQEALRLIDGLPEEATWEEILYHLYVKKKIQSGISAADEDRVVPHEEVKAMFLRK
jgi:predicted transcriptional regulator